MLLDSHLSARTKLLWSLFLLLSPLAYVAGILLIVKTDPDATAGIAIDRSRAIAIARDYAASKGLSTGGWKTYCTLEKHPDWHSYLQTKPGRETEIARRLAPEALIRVQLVSADEKENARILLTTDGKPYGFIRSLPPDREVPDSGETAARTLAESAFHGRPESGILPSPGAPILKEERTFAGVTRNYSWPYRLDSLPEMDLQFVVSVQGTTILKETIEANIDPRFLTGTESGGVVVRTAVGIAYALMIFAVLLFGLYRFVQRVRQKEVSYARVFLLAGFVAIIFLMVSLQTDVISSQALVQVSAPRRWIVFLVTEITYLFLGLFLGLAYGSGEGDIREAYPGKLTSLDALILGRFFSRNVARAIVVGSAFGGWFLLATNLALLPWRGQQMSLLRGNVSDFLLGRSPWLLPFLSPPLGTIIVIVVGLLLPISFIHRNIKSKRTALTLMIVFTWLAQLGPGSALQSWSAGLLLAAVGTGSLLLPFFRFDLLTAIISFGSSAFATLTAFLATQAVASIRQAAPVAGGIALAILGLQIFFSYRGRLYTEDQVRPLYARHLAERLKFQAEISAAREAQTRLLPVRLPSMAGLSVAASFRPAHEVGGDFYDLFALGPDKLGIFFAEGGGRGLGAALSIAFAKGFLMPKLSADVQPTEIVRRLRDRLSLMLGAGGGMGLAFAVIDASAGTLRYARTGSYPRILIGRRGDAHEIHAPEEREVADGSNDLSVPVFEGTHALTSENTVLLFTDGIGETMTAAEFWKEFCERRKDSTDQLYEALTKAVDSGVRRARELGITDDLTAIAVCLERRAAHAVEALR